jgi:membrane-associated phospholipid phosphatase
VLQDAQKPAKTFAQIPLDRHCDACWSAILLVVLSAAGLAQSRSGNLYGVVKGSGRALADVRVRLSCEDASQPVAETLTGASGRFRFTGLIWGFYSLDLAANGWQSRRIPIGVRSDGTLYVRTTLLPLASDQAQAPVEVVDEDVLARHPVWRFRNPATSSSIRSFNLWLLRHASIHVATFPSAHVAATTAASLTLMQLVPLAGLAFLLLSLSIAIGPVKGRYHYALDVVLGAALAVVVFVLKALL